MVEGVRSERRLEQEQHPDGGCGAAEVSVSLIYVVSRVSFLIVRP